MAEMRECPFCGGMDCVKVMGQNSTIFKLARVVCMDCDFGGPNFNERSKAVDWWNDREPENQDPRDMGWVGCDGLP